MSDLGWKHLTPSDKEEILRGIEGAAWKHDEAADQTVDSLCGMKGGCPIGTFYYQTDIPFLRSFNRLLETR